MHGVSVSVGVNDRYRMRIWLRTELGLGLNGGFRATFRYWFTFSCG